jgi:hypothetical protein
MSAKSQNYSQIQSVPQYFNPAFSGIYNCSNFAIRNQTKYLTAGIYFMRNSLLADIYVPEIAGAIKITAENFHYPDKIFQIQKLRFSYSYHLNFNNRNHLAFGIETEYFQENFTKNALIFPSMLNVYGGVSYSNDQNLDNFIVKNLIFSSGFVFWQKNFYLSASVNNLYSVYFQEKRSLPANLGIMFERKNITVNQYKLRYNSAIFMQKDYVNMYNGLIINYLSYQIGMSQKINLSRRGISTGTILIFGINLEKIKISYSAEFFYGNLPINQTIKHELSLVFFGKCNEKNRKNTIICPAYEL